MVDDLEKYKAKARRLLELAKRGVGGEKDNAKTKLEQLLARTGILIEEIDESLNIRTFRINSSDDGMLLTNIILSVNPYTKIVYLPTYVKCELDKEDHTEVIAKYRYFIKLWRIEKDLFTMSFFTKHEQYLRPDEYAHNKFRDTKNEKNEAFAKSEKAENKLNSNLSESLNTPPPKEFTQEQINKQKQDMLNLNRMHDMLPLMLKANYIRTYQK